jgi:hypothetical protein
LASLQFSKKKKRKKGKKEKKEKKKKRKKKRKRKVKKSLSIHYNSPGQELQLFLPWCGHYFSQLYKV